MALLLAISFAFGALISRVLLGVGLQSLVKRGALVYLLTYAFFFFAVYCWRRLADPPAVQPEQKSPPTNPSSWKGRSSRWWDGAFDGFDFDTAAIVFCCALAVILVFVWLLGEAPVILTDAFFDAGLAASLAGAALRQSASPWYARLLEKTIVPFLIFFFSSAVLLYGVELSCPQAPTVVAAFRQCWFSAQR
jgi:hypothetical protein